MTAEVGNALDGAVPNAEEGLKEAVGEELDMAGDEAPLPRFFCANRWSPRATRGAGALTAGDGSISTTAGTGALITGEGNLSLGDSGALVGDSVGAGDLLGGIDTGSFSFFAPSSDSAHGSSPHVSLSSLDCGAEFTISASD